MIFDYISKDIFIFGAALFGVVYGLTTLVQMKSQQRALNQVMKENEVAKLDAYRAHLERQLLELNMKFSSSEKRWQELNHLVVAGQSNDLNSAYDLSRGTELFFDSHGLQLTRLKMQDDLLFVLTPFHDDMKSEFDAVVKAGTSLGFQVSRGDEKLAGGDIFRRIIEMIATARVVVANISGRNPNVFYELGIAHALGKPVILIAHKETDIPFDVQSKPIVFYRNEEELSKELNSMLGRTILLH
ncbi:hypothetical protein ABFV57_10205 [Pseudomonas neuropathica]|uniref:hypothetical protein n=1 Tax=Pseudomonas TaxID=286 RepID=UPI00300EA829